MNTKIGLVVLFVLSLLLLTSQIVTAESVEENEPPFEGENKIEEPVKVQNEDPNGTCNLTMEQEMTQNGSLEQNQIHNNSEALDINNQYRWRYQYRNEIQNGIENETVVKECNISKKAGQMYINSLEYQNGMAVEVKEQSKHKLEVKVSAEFKEGKVLVLNIDESAFKVKNSQKLIIKFDGAEMKQENINEVISAEGSEAKYAAAAGEDGGQYVVYIPHFSEHLITFEIVDAESSQSMYIMLGAVGIGLLTILILSLVVVKIGKLKKD